MADGGKDELWFEADAELVEQLAREAEFCDETIGEYVDEACQRRAQDG